MSLARQVLIGRRKSRLINWWLEGGLLGRGGGRGVAPVAVGHQNGRGWRRSLLFIMSTARRANHDILSTATEAIITRQAVSPSAIPSMFGRDHGRVFAAAHGSTPNPDPEQSIPADHRVPVRGHRRRPRVVRRGGVQEEVVAARRPVVVVDVAVVAQVGAVSRVLGHDDHRRRVVGAQAVVLASAVVALEAVLHQDVVERPVEAVGASALVAGPAVVAAVVVLVHVRLPARDPAHHGQAEVLGLGQGGRVDAGLAVERSPVELLLAELEAVVAELGVDPG